MPSSSGSPRVLFVTHNAPRYVGDAAGSFVLRLAVALHQAGAGVDILAPGAAARASQDVIEGISIKRVRYAPDAQMNLAYEGQMAEIVKTSLRAKINLAKLLFSMRRATSRALKEAQREGRPYHVVHAHWWFPSALAVHRLRERQRQSIPLVITMHGSDVRLAEHSKPAHVMMRSVLEEAALCTTVSSWLRGMAAAIVPDASIVVSPMPVDMRTFTDSREQRSGILFAGRLNRQKGLSDLLKAMTMPELQSATLDIVGDGIERASLMALAAQYGIENRLRWHGALPQSQLALMYQRARVVAIPSRGEGLGLVAVEAQLAGTPVVAYEDGGLPDVVRVEHGGSLVKPGDTVTLANAVASLINNPDLAEQKGSSAAAAMRDLFTPEAAAERYLDHYRTVQQ